MGLAKRHLDLNDSEQSFSVDELATLLKKSLSEASFGLILGSAKEGIVKAHSDLDLAFYLNKKPSLNFYNKVNEIVESIIPDVRVDIGILNSAEVVFRFESLKGRLLFKRDEETYAHFFSLTCREYESQMFNYEKQHRYRLEAMNAL